MSMMLVVAFVVFLAGGAGEPAPYNLTVTPSQETVATGKTLRAEYCLLPREGEPVEVCLGVMRGYDLSGSPLGITQFRLPPGTGKRCTCELPLVLDRDKPLCWPEYIEVEDFGGPQLRLRGLITLLEGTFEEGESADSCLEIRSDTVVFVRQRSREI